MKMRLDKSERIAIFLLPEIKPNRKFWFIIPVVDDLSSGVRYKVLSHGMYIPFKRRYLVSL